MWEEKFASLLTSMAIPFLLMPLALAQEPSPAGGGWLELNGVDSFALCPDDNSLDKNLKDFTIEAWVYPRKKPKRDEWRIIAAKPGSYELALIGPNDRLQSQSVEDFGILFRIYSIDPGGFTKLVAQKGQMGFPADFNFNKWHHVAAVFFKQQIWLEIYVDGIHVSTGRSNMAPGPPNTLSAFYVGGAEDRKGEFFFGCREGSYFFDGCIDELRISSIARPIRADVQISRLDADRYTEALWHFDEPEGAASFQDSSSNGNTLFGIGGGFPVASKGKLAATWASIKSGY